MNVITIQRKLSLENSTYTQQMIEPDVTKLNVNNQLGPNFSSNQRNYVDGLQLRNILYFRILRKYIHSEILVYSKFDVISEVKSIFERNIVGTKTYSSLNNVRSKTHNLLWCSKQIAINKFPLFRSMENQTMKFSRPIPSIFSK